MCPVGLSNPDPELAAAGLPLVHRIMGRPVIVLGAGEMADAKRRLVARAGGVVFGDVDEGLAAGARLAFIASLAEDDVAEATRLRAAGVLVNVVDAPAQCDFTVPAIVARAPLLVAVSTGGASAGLAKALRLRLEALLPGDLGALARGLHNARGWLARRYPDSGARRHRLDGLLADNGPLDPLREGAAARLTAWMAESTGAGADAGADTESTPAARVVEVRLRSPDPDDLSLREARALGQADVLGFEPGVPASVLARARADAARCPIARGAAPPEAITGLTVVVRAPITQP